MVEVGWSDQFKQPGSVEVSLRIEELRKFLSFLRKKRLLTNGSFALNYTVKFDALLNEHLSTHSAVLLRCFWAGCNVLEVLLLHLLAFILSPDTSSSTRVDLGSTPDHFKEIKHIFDSHIHTSTSSEASLNVLLVLVSNEKLQTNIWLLQHNSLSVDSNLLFQT
jgi:hypothetical protein